MQEERKKGRNVSASSRRRKGPAFLPAEHDDLPSGVAFMVRPPPVGSPPRTADSLIPHRRSSVTSHRSPLSTLPSRMEWQSPQVWTNQCASGTSRPATSWVSCAGTRVRGLPLLLEVYSAYTCSPTGVVKALQVESSVCVTGGADGQIRIWDLDLAEAERSVPLATPSAVDGLTNSMDAMNFSEGGAGLVNGNDEGMMREEGGRAAPTEAGPCVRTLDGHTKAVTSLYFDESCLVRLAVVLNLRLQANARRRSLALLIGRCGSGTSRRASAS